MDKGAVLPALGGVDEGDGASGDGHQTRVDSRLRRERRCRNTAFECEIVPRPELSGHHRRAAHRGAAARDLPLHKQHRGRPVLSVQEPPQDRGGLVKRQVAHDGVRCPGQPESQEVAMDDGGAGLHLRP